MCLGVNLQLLIALEKDIAAATDELMRQRQKNLIWDGFISQCHSCKLDIGETTGKQLYLFAS